MLAGPDPIIEELPEGSEWTSPIVLVKKSSGETRFCIDYRRLNDVSIVGHHPIPYVEDALEGLAGFTAFHSLDLKSAYWQIGLSKDAQRKCAFVCPGYPVYTFKRMPFGLQGAPATFQRLVEKVLPVAKTGKLGQDLKNSCIAYLDDILIPAKNFDHGLQALEVVLYYYIYYYNIIFEYI